ncbi:myo-inosose-2 dehydratase [Dyadobacter sediminis]|uniref:Myo-inosose-2 dehydratase n=1 Tax=Dyadobacter sediminis TaxID=1493691 RepID=A0A5R9KJY4_9BACT|nr:myo-inosose-2 dehydratase [Dyadobacter sediminis]TLU96494.1 myo-inosose-2 dehydratase [Dyadobacter sediminis]GGB82677.1 inosose dehydratase [Dyadobacter sediminis]
MNFDNIKLGVAPIIWTNDDMPELGGENTFEQCVSEMALAGFTGCEVGNKFPRDVNILKKALDLRGLQICNQWNSYELTTKSFAENRENFTRLLDFLENMGAKVIGGGETGNSCQGQMTVPVLEGKGMLNTREEWNSFTFGLNELGKIAHDRGLKLAFHHHMGTCIQTMEETDRLLHKTDPEYVFLNYDCGHFYFAGEDPVAALQKYIGRTAHIHLKDVRQNILQSVHDDRLSFLTAVKKGVFTVPGDPEGCIDFPALFSIIKSSDYHGWIVLEAEQDPSKANPLEYAMIARKYFRDLTGI